MTIMRSLRLSLAANILILAAFVVSAFSMVPFVVSAFSMVPLAHSFDYEKVRLAIAKPEPIPLSEPALNARLRAADIRAALEHHQRLHYDRA